MRALRSSRCAQPLRCFSTEQWLHLQPSPPLPFHPQRLCSGAGSLGCDFGLCCVAPLYALPFLLVCSTRFSNLEGGLPGSLRLHIGLTSCSIRPSSQGLKRGSISPSHVQTAEIFWLQAQHVLRSGRCCVPTGADAGASGAVRLGAWNVSVHILTVLSWGHGHGQRLLLWHSKLLFSDAAEKEN